MTLPVPPDARVILQNSVVTLREVVAPLAEDEWARFNASLLIGALEYALGVMEKDRGAEHRAHLTAKIDSLRAAIERSGDAETKVALAEASPFVAASRLLVWGQNNPGALATEIQRVLRSELYAQLDQEITAAEPIKGAFFRGMAGEI
jgi:hypothetical protein